MIVFKNILDKIMIRNSIPNAQEKRATYENFIASCPICSFENIFNRASDLNGGGLISHKQVVCQNINCAKPFNISGDSVSAAYEMLIYDCYELKRSKHYMYCILNLAQAHESFFSLYLRNELLYKPFSLDPNRNTKEFNKLSENLYNTIEKLTFRPMRNLFFYQVCLKTPVTSLIQAESMINELSKKQSSPIPKVEVIKSSFDKELADLLVQLKDTTIDKTRNSVVHKYAYRPTLQEIEKEIERTRKILFPLAQKLRIKEFIL